MKFSSRCTLGVCIGGINILGFSLTIIYIIVVLCDFASLTDEEKKFNQDVWTRPVALLYIILVMCVFMVIISSLLIVGIIQRRYKLMAPWLICAIVGFFLQIFRWIVSLVYVLLLDKPNAGGAFGMFFATAFLIWCIEFPILDIIYFLYKDIKNKTHEVAVAGLYPLSYRDLENKEEMVKQNDD